MSASARRVRIIVNPIAGKGDGPARADAVERMLEREGCRVERFNTQAAGDAAKLSHEAAAQKVDVVLICGGDGTVNEAVQGLAETDVALAVMPLGTANLIGYELGLSRRPERVVDLVLHGRRRKMDAGRCGDRRFLCVAGAGIDAEVARRLAEVRTGAISHLSYAKPMLGALRGYTFPPMRVRVDGVPIEAPVYELVIGNTRNYAGPFRVAPDAKADDGLLDVAAFTRAGAAAMLFYMAAIAVRAHHRLPSVCFARGRRIEVEADEPVAVELDGDFRTVTPATFEVMPGAMTMLSHST